MDFIHDVTKVDKWFLNKLKKLADFEKEMAGGLTGEMYLRAKKMGYPDAAIKRLSGA